MMCISDGSSHRRTMCRWLLLVATLVGCDPPGAEAPGSAGAGSPAPQLDYQPAASVARLRWDSLSVDETDAHDVALLHDTLVVLDRRAQRLALLVGRESVWRHVRYIGGPGDGPGRFRRPASVATGTDGVMEVLEDDGRVQRLDRDGTPLHERRLRFPCVPFSVSVALTSDDQLVIGGLCAPGGASRDTVFAMAWRHLGDSELEEVARVPVATTSLQWGGVPMTARFVTTDGGDVVFASGIDGCSVTVPGPTPPAVVPDSGTADRKTPRAVVRRDCRPLPARYRGTRPATWRDLKMPNGSVARWPDPFQAFAAAVWSPTPVVLQMISSDSLVLNQVASGAAELRSEPLLVTPSRRFVGCTDGRCVWFDVVMARIAVVDVRRLSTGTGTTTGAR